MNLEEMTKFNLSNTEVERMKSYIEKAETAEVHYCSEHDREFYLFEFQGMCPICFEDSLWSRFEHGDQEAGEILKKSGRLEDD